MPGESSHERGRGFVNKVCLFFDRKYGFNIVENSYEGEDTASLEINNETLRFDIFMNQKRIRELGGVTREEYQIRFICECKSKRRSSGLRGDFRDFLNRALKAVSYLNTRYRGKFYFLFITNKFFTIKENELNNISYLNEFIIEDVETNNLQTLSSRIGVLALPEWFLDLSMEGRWNDRKNRNI